MSYLSFEKATVHLALETLDFLDQSDRSIEVEARFDRERKTVALRRTCARKDEHGRVVARESSERRYRLVGRIYQKSASVQRPACFDE